MLVNNTVVCDHFKSIVAGGGQNGKKETTCSRPNGVTPSMGITLMQDTYPPLPPLLSFSWHCAHSRIQSFNQYQAH